MIEIPTLATPRLVMRPLRETDFEAYAAMLADPEVTRFLGNGKTSTRGEAWRHLAMLVGHWQLRGFGMWAVTLRGDDAMIGRAGFFQPEGWPGFEIGWSFARAAWGRGYATEAGREALRYAFDVLGRGEAISVIHPDNAASIRVASKIGAVFDRAQEVNGQPRHIYVVRAGPRRMPPSRVEPAR